MRAGNKDENIAWNQGMEFYVDLRRNKKVVIALFYPEKGHDLEPNTAERRDLDRRVFEWLDYFLKDKKDFSWISKQIKEDAI
ncbi:alpha/beta hydrolase family protein [Chryseobacterium polytrichastri]|uniref:alpha/beta hydrolase family protein n=1 Tax=Chryseobacterium polytrichastri TaxID=1302687 RepID=UPI000933229F|nr:prolyl oligopeptidase family serine peptidase [Chryseobacterium polytrichastri]